MPQVGPGSAAVVVNIAVNDERLISCELNDVIVGNVIFS